MAAAIIICGTLAALGILQLFYNRYRKGLRAIPGPFLASISNYWKISGVYHGDMHHKNRKVHEKYGPVVRIGPNHVSFASVDALNLIHGSKQAFAKSDFYKPTSPWHNGMPLFHLFSIQDIGYHSQLKRNINLLYTKVGVKDFEPKIDECITTFVDQIHKRYENGQSTFDMSRWLHFWAFDCLGELNVSRKFGFLETGEDVRGMIATADHVLEMTGLLAQAPLLLSVQKIYKRSQGSKKNPLVAFTFACIEERRKNPTSSVDMLNKFLKLQEAEPDKLSTREIAGSVYINLMAGHDVLAITLRAIWYYLARSPQAMESLRSEFLPLENEYAPGLPVPYDKLTGLSYLDAVVHESLRIHPNTGLTPERLVPPEGAIIDGYSIPGNTIVGVNAWNIHFNPDLYGENVFEFRPERWINASDGHAREMKRNLFSFGAGPRVCIGRNIAMLQIYKVVFEFYRRFDVALADPAKEWKVSGNWVTKQTDMPMIVRPREVAN